jgi:hypothetical protein
MQEQSEEDTFFGWINLTQDFKFLTSFINTFSAHPMMKKGPDPFACQFNTVLDHFTEKSFYRIFLTERHLTETPF